MVVQLVRSMLVAGALSVTRGALVTVAAGSVWVWPAPAVTRKIVLSVTSRVIGTWLPRHRDVRQSSSAPGGDSQAAGRPGLVQRLQVCHVWLAVGGRRAGVAGDQA